MHITSKGQVTIPIEIRNKLGLLPDTEVEFSIENNAVVLRKAGKASVRGKRLIQAMRGKATTRMSTDEIMALTRES
ncbi:MAG: AbrB/MazE/SpoVT family DNA-binding domain-containing protein [Gammaproteobacteria bacterium]|jgi:AbrB family looped-hinge helix DNA binding protein|nr:AbrB/MazE/SpoVT family DNA-binding domain-containing protein [Gammaproteobacteria bacterium]